LFAAAIQRAAKCAECWSIFRASFRRAASWRVAPNEGFLKFAASVGQTNGEQSRLFRKVPGTLKFL
jgi:hypothetical protein